MLLANGFVALKGGRTKENWTDYTRTLLPVGIVAHPLGDILEVAVGPCNVGVDMRFWKYHSLNSCSRVIGPAPRR